MIRSATLLPCPLISQRKAYGGNLARANLQAVSNVKGKIGTSRAAIQLGVAVSLGCFRHAIHMADHDDAYKQFLSSTSWPLQML